MLKGKVEKFPSETVSVSTTKPTGGKFIFIVSFRCRLCIKAHDLSRSSPVSYLDFSWNLLFGVQEICFKFECFVVPKDRTIFVNK